MRRGYDRVMDSIDRRYDKIEGVTVSVSRNLEMLSEVTTSSLDQPSGTHSPAIFGMRS